MKNFVLALVLFTLAALGWSQNLVVAVVPFEAKTGYTPDEVEAITDLFSSCLVQAGGFDVVTRSQFDKIVGEAQFQRTGLTSEADYVRLGAALNAKAIITGSIMKLGSRTILSITLLEVETAKMLSSSRTQFNSLDELVDKLPGLAKELVKPMTPKPAAPAYTIGSRGPGGGTVFYAQGGTYMEYSGGFAGLGKFSWDDAVKTARSYRGGGFTDWHLPTQQELDLLYQRYGNGDLYYYTLWSSLEYDSRNAWCQSRGRQFYQSKREKLRVYAVRTFRM